MTNRTAATRYARALLDVALKEKADLPAIERELAALLALLRANTERSAKVLLEPGRPGAAQARRRRELVDRAGASRRSSASCSCCSPSAIAWCCCRICSRPTALRLLDHQQRRPRGSHDRRAAAPNAPTRSARASPARPAATVVLTSSVDPAIIGGMVARVGGTVYDAQRTRRSSKMKERLTTV